MQVVEAASEGGLPSVRILIKEEENINVLNDLLAANKQLFG